MPHLDPKPDPFHYKGKGTKVSIESLNQIVRAVLRQIRGGVDTDVSYYGDRLLIDNTTVDSKLPSISNYLVQFVVLEEHEDYLLCAPFQLPTSPDRSKWIPQLYDIALGTNNPGVDSIMRICVAKPYLLQQTPWLNKTVVLNGQSVAFTYTGIGTRVATDGTNAESQVIVPGYFPGDVILTALIPMGLQDRTQQSIVWMDLNTAARAWALGDTVPATSLGVQTQCSPNPVPDRLMVTFGPNTPPSCLDGQSFLITYQPGLGANSGETCWRGSTQLPSGQNIQMNFFCVPGTGWTFSILYENTAGSDSGVLQSQTETPTLSVTFSMDPTHYLNDPCFTNLYTVTIAP